MLATLAALALLAGDAGGGPLLEGAVAAGAGYDGGAALGPGGLGSAAGTASAAVGASLDLGQHVGLYAGAHLAGLYYADAGDLNRTQVDGEASVSLEYGDFALVLAPSAGWAWNGDPSRDGAVWTGRLALRFRAGEALVLRTSYGHTSRGAADPVYATEWDRIAAGLEWRIGEQTFLSAWAGVGRGDEVFYLPAASAAAVAMGPGSGGPGTGGGLATSVPVNAEAAERRAGLDLELGLGGGIHLDLGAAIRRVEAPVSDPATYFSLLGQVGWRL